MKSKTTSPSRARRKARANGPASSTPPAILTPARSASANEGLPETSSKPQALRVATSRTADVLPQPVGPIRKGTSPAASTASTWSARAEIAPATACRILSRKVAAGDGGGGEAGGGCAAIACGGVIRTTTPLSGTAPTLSASASRCLHGWLKCWPRCCQSGQSHSRSSTLGTAASSVMLVR